MTQYIYVDTYKVPIDTISFHYRKKTLPDFKSLLKLTKLTTLKLSNNKYDNIPDDICKLTNLTNLNLSYNNLIKLPTCIDNLTNLTNLNLFQNKITELPENFTKLTNLTVLNLENNNLTKLPDNIGNLSKLEKLYVNTFPDGIRNDIRNLPKSFVNLVNLRYDKYVYFTNYILNFISTNLGIRNSNDKDNINIFLNSIINNKKTQYIEKVINIINVYLLLKDKIEFNEIYPALLGYSYNITYNFLKCNNIKKLIEFIILLDKKQRQESISDELNYKYKYYCNLIKETQILSKNELQNKIINFIKNNPKSELIFYYDNNKIKKTIEEDYEELYQIKNVEQIKKYKLYTKYTKKDIYYYFNNFYDENKFNLYNYTSSKITYDNIFEQFTDIVYTIYDFKKENKKCNDCTKDDIVFFLQQKFSKDELCRYMTQLEDIYIEYMKENIDCTNKNLLISGNEIEEVPYGQLVIYKDKTNNTEYCFTIDELEKIKETKLNPYNNQPIPDEIFEEIDNRKKYKDWVVKSEVDESVLLELAKYDISYIGNKIYSDLYYYMTNIGDIHPIDREDYKKKDINELKNKFRQYINEVITEGILSSDERNNVINSPPEQFHIKLANAILKIVEKEDSNQKGRMLLLKQIGIF